MSVQYHLFPSQIFHKPDEDSWYPSLVRILIQRQLLPRLRLLPHKRPLRSCLLNQPSKRAPLYGTLVRRQRT
jgi:hypothetical protein